MLIPDLLLCVDAQKAVIAIGARFPGAPCRLGQGGGHMTDRSTPR
jgi:hypothetical protein